jgi:hypothetical protein
MKKAIFFECFILKEFHKNAFKTAIILVKFFNQDINEFVK